MILFLAILTMVDVKSEGCRVACIYESYDSGSFKNGKCLCVKELLYSDMTQKKSTTLPDKPKPDYEF